jgi:hypothetical protein
MVHAMCVLRGVLIFRLIAAADMAAGHAEPQVDPGIAHFEAFLTSIRRAGNDILDGIDVFASGFWHIN